MSVSKVKEDPYYRASVAIRKDREVELKEVLAKLSLKTVGELVQLVMMPGVVEELQPAAARRAAHLQREKELDPERQRALRALREMNATDLLKLAAQAGVSSS